MIWRLIVPLLSKNWLILTNLGQSLSQKVGCVIIVEPILPAGFLHKILAVSNKKSTFVIASGCLGCCVFTVLLK